MFLDVRVYRRKSVGDDGVTTSCMMERVISFLVWGNKKSGLDLRSNG